jgi:hypothetical protein
MSTLVIGYSPRCKQVRLSCARRIEDVAFQPMADRASVAAITCSRISNGKVPTTIDHPCSHSEHLTVSTVWLVMWGHAPS